MKVWVVTVAEGNWGEDYKRIRGVYSTYERARAEKDKFDGCEDLLAVIEGFELEE